MRTVKAEPLPIINTLLWQLFAVFATVIKLIIAAGLRGPAIVPHDVQNEKIEDVFATDLAVG